jgi:predicted amidohydrolase
LPVIPAIICPSGKSHSRQQQKFQRDAEINRWRNVQELYPRRHGYPVSIQICNFNGKFVQQTLSSMQNLRVTLIQTRLYWEDRTRNIRHITSLLDQVKPGSTDLIILPEMFTSGFTMNATKVSDTMYGIGVVFMTMIAKELKADVCGSLVIEERKKFYNRLVWVTKAGKIYYYDKRHLFRMANEQKTYTAGNKKLHMKLKGWNICPMVCYDLRFPVWSRSDGSTDLMIFVANWPARRRFAWNQLLIARAIENQCYVAGVNRVGKDGNDIPYTGDSAVLDFMGSKISKTKAGRQSVETITLKREDLSSYRKAFPVFRDADLFTIIA